ncbi:MAG TPA: serine/threonine protein phosphatase, partial [Plasticicumulans sp.]|nr:serine/threonine protein phosphatase [Plasticicumulans sp.]
MSAAGSAAGVHEARPWPRALLWLAVLGPLFFLSYGAANWLASRRAGVGSLVFDWEHAIPFWPWTILPYWSIDLLYALPLFVCTTRRELD